MPKESDQQTPFVRELEERGITLPPEIPAAFDLEQVQSYYDFLIQNNEKGGFFSRGDSERILERHLLESLVFCYHVARALNVSRETKVADAGSGPGLPGYLFACMKKPPRLTLIDSSRRRLGLLQEFTTRTEDLRPLDFRFGRLEEIRAQFDIVLIRALIPFPFCLELVGRLQKKKGHTVYFGARSIPPATTPKRDNSNQGWEAAYLRKLGYVSRETIQPEEIQFLGDRSINILLKSGLTENGYPRPWKTIRDEMRNRNA